MKSRLEYPPLVAAQKQLASLQAQHPPLIAAKEHTARAEATARTKDADADIEVLLGRRSAKDREKVGAGLLDARKAAKLADEALANCEAASDALRRAQRQLEVESRAWAWSHQKPELLSLAAEALDAAQKLADVQVRLRGLRDHVDAEHTFVPPGSEDSIVRDAHGAAIGKIYDGPNARLRLPDGTCGSILGLGMAFKGVTPELVERFRQQASAFGVKV
jgi:hypothetical protein